MIYVFKKGKLDNMFYLLALYLHDSQVSFYSIFEHELFTGKQKRENKTKIPKVEENVSKQTQPIIQEMRNKPSVYF